tara:strand:- start:882 stop:1388 length:507 start_codon:yes stop_codon:yes gene_type:complete
MIYFYKNQIFLLLGLIFLFSCGVEEKVKGKIDEIDEAYITVSGNLSHNDSSITVGIIFLLEGSVSLDLEKLSLELDNLELVNGSISLFNGNYTIFNVTEGEYYVVAIEDNNANLEYDPNIDRVGLYGFNLYDFDPIPDIVTVTEEDVEDININYFFFLESPLRGSLKK